MTEIKDLSVCRILGVPHPSALNGTLDPLLPKEFVKVHYYFLRLGYIYFESTLIFSFYFSQDTKEDCYVARLHVKRVDPLDARTYSLTVENERGLDKHSIFLAVRGSYTGKFQLHNPLFTYY